MNNAIWKMGIVVAVLTMTTCRDVHLIDPGSVTEKALLQVPPNEPSTIPSTSPFPNTAPGEYYDPDEKASLSVSNSALGKTHFVRIDGGTLSQCSGLIDAAYSADVAPNCAVNSLSAAVAYTGKLAANRLAPGDHVRIHAGVYYDRVSFSQNLKGTATNRILIGPYGDGEVVIDASVQGLSWTVHSGNIYVTDWPLTVPAKTLVIDEVPYFPVLAGQNQSNISQGRHFYYDATNRKLYCRTLAGDSPANHTVLAMEARSGSRVNSGHALSVYHADYYTIYGLTIRGASEKGISILADGVTLEKNDVRFCQGTGIAPYSYGTTWTIGFRAIKNRVYHTFLDNWPRGIAGYHSAGWGKGIDALAVRAPYYSGNLVYKNGGEGIGIGSCNDLNSCYDGTPGIMEDNLVYDNWSVNIYSNAQHGLVIRRNMAFVESIDPSEMTNNGYEEGTQEYTRARRRLQPMGISTGEEAGKDYMMDFVDIYNNILVNHSTGIAFVGDATNAAIRNHSVHNNTIILPNYDVYNASTVVPGANHAFGIAYGTNNGRNENNLITNNIIHGRFPNTRLIQVDAINEGAPDRLRFDRNIFWHATDAASLSYHGALYDLAGWKSATGDDANSAFANPLLTGPIGSPIPAAYNPLLDSPARGIAESLNLFQDDFAGRVRSQPWTAGALQ